MTSMFPGPRSHGAPQDTDMDLAWQELMAITELREFGGISEGSYESTHYQTIEPMAPVGEYEPASSHPPHPPATCELNSSDIYSTSYSEVVRNCQHHGSNKGLMYGLTEPQQSPKLLLTSSPQPSLVTRRDFINMSDTNQEHRRANVCHSWGFGPNMRWASQGQPGQTDDIESDSGLSLDSSPPLASPDNPVCALGYQNKDISLTYRVGESDAMISITKEVRTLYPIECQSETTEYLQTGAHLPFVSFQPSSSQFQGSTLMSHSVKPQSQAAALCDIYSDAAMSSRQKSPLKPQGNISTPASLSRDERRALALKIPFPMEKIVNLPVDDFNELLTQYTLTDTQMALVRDIRRRGKNKVAAQNCRKRKLESIIHLERELNQLKTQKERMVQERLKFQHSLTFIKCCLTDLYAEVFSQLRDEKGQSYSTDEYFLQQTLDGKFYLVPHTMH